MPKHAKPGKKSGRALIAVGVVFLFSGVIAGIAHVSGMIRMDGVPSKDVNCAEKYADSAEKQEACKGMVKRLGWGMPVLGSLLGVGGIVMVGLGAYYLNKRAQRRGG